MILIQNENNKFLIEIINETMNQIISNFKSRFETHGAFRADLSRNRECEKSLGGIFCQSKVGVLS